MYCIAGVLIKYGASSEQRLDADCWYISLRICNICIVCDIEEREAVLLFTLEQSRQPIEFDLSMKELTLPHSYLLDT